MLAHDVICHESLSNVHHGPLVELSVALTSKSSRCHWSIHVTMNMPKARTGPNDPTLSRCQNPIPQSLHPSHSPRLSKILAFHKEGKHFSKCCKVMQTISAINLINHIYIRDHINSTADKIWKKSWKNSQNEKFWRNTAHQSACVVAAATLKAYKGTRRVTEAKQSGECEMPRGKQVNRPNIKRAQENIVTFQLTWADLFVELNTIFHSVPFHKSKRWARWRCTEINKLLILPI